MYHEIYKSTFPFIKSAIFVRSLEGIPVIVNHVIIGRYKKRAHYSYRYIQQQDTRAGLP